jgi:hypothetical protein
MDLLRSIIMGGVLCVVSAGAAVATPTTYHLSSVSPTNSVSGYGVTFVGANIPLTFDFTVAAPLAANLAPADIIAQVLSYKASGGQAESTITDLDYVGSYKQIELATDAQGNITDFHFHVVGQNLVLPNPPNYLDFSFAGSDGNLSSEDLLFYRADRQFNYGAVDCANANCGTNSGFTVLSNSDVTVPEPSTWTLLIVGFGMAVAVLRRRRTAVAA